MSRLECLFLRSYGNKISDHLITEGETLIIICELCDIYERRSREVSERQHDDAAFLSSIAHLYQHYNEGLTIDNLARMAQMSRNSYIAKFKRVMGHPPARFIKLYKVDIIKQMLTNTSLSEAEIANNVGCSDVSHLIKLFSSETGVSPSVYRRGWGI